MSLVPPALSTNHTSIQNIGSCLWPPVARRNDHNIKSQHILNDVLINVFKMQLCQILRSEVNGFMRDIDQPWWPDSYHCERIIPEYPSLHFSASLGFWCVNLLSGSTKKSMDCQSIVNIPNKETKWNSYLFSCLLSATMGSCHCCTQIHRFYKMYHTPPKSSEPPSKNSNKKQIAYDYPDSTGYSLPTSLLPEIISIE